MTTYQDINKTLDVHNHPFAQAHIIQNDQEALEIAQQLSQQFKENAVLRDAERILPFDEVEAFSQSGLWAITVPRQYGGAEVSSHTVAKIIALFSGVDGSIGQIPQNHFYALEVLRNTGTEQQKKNSIAKYFKAHVLAMLSLNLRPRLLHKSIPRLVKLNMVMWSMGKSSIARAVYLPIVFQH